MIFGLRKIFFIFISLRIKSKKNLSFKNLDFRKIDFTNYHQIKNFIFRKNFYKTKDKNIHSFDFLNFSNKLGGKIGINLSKETIFSWFKVNKYKMGFPWLEDLSSKRLVNLLYNYEYINSSSKPDDKEMLDLIIFFHIQRVLFDFKIKKISEITSFDLIAYLLSLLILKKNNINKIE